MAHIGMDSLIVKRVFEILLRHNELTRSELREKYLIKYPRSKRISPLVAKFDRLMKKLLPGKWPERLFLDISSALDFLHKEGCVEKRKVYRFTEERDVTSFSVTPKGRSVFLSTKSKK